MGPARAQQGQVPYHLRGEKKNRKMRNLKKWFTKVKSRVISTVVRKKLDINWVPVKKYALSTLVGIRRQ
jgi:hypothetical protein